MDMADGQQWSSGYLNGFLHSSRVQNQVNGLRTFSREQNFLGYAVSQTKNNGPPLSFPFVMYIYTYCFLYVCRSQIVYVR